MYKISVGSVCFIIFIQNYVCSFEKKTLNAICILIIWHNTVLIELLRNVMDDSLCLLRSWDSHYCYTNIYTDLLLHCVFIVFVCWTWLLFIVTWVVYKRFLQLYIFMTRKTFMNNNKGKMWHKNGYINFQMYTLGTLDKDGQYCQIFMYIWFVSWSKPTLVSEKLWRISLLQNCLIWVSRIDYIVSYITTLH